jgi:predicted amidohydrolase
MIIASAQTRAFSQNTEANIQSHLRLINQAAENKVKLIVFPEMSLTGYERENAKALSFTPDDKRLEVFRECSDLHEIVIIAGAPIETNNRLVIGAFVFSPGNPPVIYSKQFLHEGEEKFFSTDDRLFPFIEWEDEKISLAICADIENPLHIINAAKIKSTLYLAGIFYTPASMDRAYKKLKGYAKQYNISILMSNFSGTSYQLEAGGKSAFWNNEGELRGNLEDDYEGLLVMEKVNNEWCRKYL